MKSVVLVLGLFLGSAALGQIPSGNSRDSANQSWSRQFAAAESRSGPDVTAIAGDAVLTLQFPFPRGTGGLTPSLSLTYNSGDPSNGPLGVGWHLDFPTIERRLLPGIGTVFEQVDGAQRSRLLEIGSYSSGRLFATQTAPTGPFYFYDEAGDFWTYVDFAGASWIYGRSPSLRGGSLAASRCWYLEEVSGAHGSRILASYSRSGEELVLSALGYVEGPPSAPLSRDEAGAIANLCEAFHYCLELGWEARPDPVSGAHDGQLYTLRDRLARIDLKAAGSRRLSWVLGYRAPDASSPGRTERSALDSIARVGSTGTATLSEPIVRLSYPSRADRWESQSWEGLPPFPNGLSALGDFDGDGRADVMSVMPAQEPANTWVFVHSLGNSWFDPSPNGQLDRERGLSLAWPPGPYRFILFPRWALCDGNPFLDSSVWELPPAGSAFVGDFDGNGLSDVAFAKPFVPRAPDTTLPWQMFLSSGDGWLGSSRTNPVLTEWRGGPVAELPKIDCSRPRLYSLGIYCRVGSYDDDESDDLACFRAQQRKWQIAHAAKDRWNVEEVDAGFAPAQEIPRWGENCFAGDLDGNGVDELVCPSVAATGFDVLRRETDGRWQAEAWTVELPPGVTLAGCLPARLNEDGLGDVICATSESAKWLLAVSDGRRFRAGALSAGFKTKDLREDCFTADVDNDSRSDLVCLEKAPNRFVLAFSRGEVLAPPESFVPPIPRSIGEPGWCRFGDFNGDAGLDVACVAGDFGASIVTQAAVRVPDALDGYVDTLGASARFAFSPASEDPLEAPVLPRRYLKSVEVDPGAGQPSLRRVYTYGGKPIGPRRAPKMTFSEVSERVSEVGAAGEKALFSTASSYFGWAGTSDPLALLKSVVTRAPGGCEVKGQEWLFRAASGGPLLGAPQLSRYRETGAAEPESGGSCGTLVPLRTEEFEYDGEGRVACVNERSRSDSPWLYRCLGYGEGRAVPAAVDQIPPRVERFGVFGPCGRPNDECAARETFPELAGSETAPDPVHAFSRLRIDFHSSAGACNPSVAVSTQGREPRSVVAVDGAGLERALWSGAYDVHGNLACEARAGAPVRKTEWNALGNLPTRSCAGSAGCWDVGFSGGSDAAAPATPPGLLTRLGKPWGGHTDFSFDALGRLESIADTERGTVRIGRKDFGQPAAQTLSESYPDGDKREVRLDGLGRAVEVTNRPVLGVPAVTENRYDGIGRLIATSAPHRPGDPPRWRAYTFDALGRMTREVEPDGVSHSVRYSPDAVLWTNGAGRSLRVGMQSNELGERLEFSWVAPKPMVVGQYSLDPLGRLRRLSDGSGLLASWTYNSYGDLEALEERGIGVTQFRYDELGRRVQAEDEAHGVRRWEYDAEGRTTEVRTGRWPFRRVQSYRYSDSVVGLGRLSSASDGWTTFTWTFDSQARPAAMRLRESSFFGRRDLGLAFGYDARSRLRHLELPDRRAVDWIYAGGRVRAVEDSLSGQAIVSYEDYDEHGLPGTERFANGVSASRERDVLGRLRRVSLQSAAEALSFDITYTADGSVQQVLRNGSRELEAAFDGAARLTTLETTSGRRLFSYDDLGNVATVEPGPRLEYGAPHPHALTAMDGRPTENDEALRVTRLEDVRIRYRSGLPERFGHGWRFWKNSSVGYDALDNPYLLRSRAGTQRRALGVWIEQEPGDCSVSIPSPFGVVAVSPCGAVAYEVVHGGPGGMLLSTSESKEHALFGRGYFDPFERLPRALEGTLRPSALSLPEPRLRVQGRRLLDAAVGRFLAPDPVYPPEETFFEINRFAFGRNDPMRFADPLGRQSFPMSMSTSMPSGFGYSAGSFGGQLFAPPTFSLQLPAPIRVNLEFSSPAALPELQASAPPAEGILRSLFTYRGEPWVTVDVDWDASVSSSVGGPSFSIEDGSWSAPLGPVSYGSDGSGQLALNLLTPEHPILAMLVEAGPVLRYQPGGGVGFGLYGRAGAFSGQVTATPAIGGGTLSFAQDLEQAITAYIWSMTGGFGR